MALRYLVLKAKDMYEMEKIVLKSILSLLEYSLVLNVDT